MNDVVLLFDVDNTLLDNDAVAADIRGRLRDDFGGLAERYWQHFEAIRNEVGYADYLGALQRLRGDVGCSGEAGHKLMAMSAFLLDYPFERRVYPGAIDVLAKWAAIAPTVIVSDGDIVFQPRKLKRSGLWDAVDGRVLVFVHKEKTIDEIERAWPARRYVMVDDKERILAAMKAVLGERLVTVFPRQGHYASDPDNFSRYAAADCTVARIGDLLGVDLAALLDKNRP